MKRQAPLLFVLGALALAGLVAYAGIGPLFQALAGLGVGGLTIVILIHLPVLVVLGLAWWSVGHDLTGAPAWKFVWARLVREAAAENLPFSQIGGFVLAARALTLTGVRALTVTASMLTDLVVELSAKLPYMLAGLILLLVTVPSTGIEGVLAGSVIATSAAIVSVVVFRHRIKDGLEAAAIRLGRRWPQLGLSDSAQMRRVLDSLFARDVSLLSGFVLHLTAWGMGAAETWVTLRLMGVPVTMLDAVVLDALVAALRTAGFIVPAALGVQEGGYVLIGGLLGMDPASALALSLVRRARELAIGLPGIAGWQAIEGRRAFARTDKADLPRSRRVISR